MIEQPNDVVDVMSIAQIGSQMSVMSKRAQKIRDKINERESSEKNQRLYFLIQDKLNDPQFIENAVMLQDHDETNGLGEYVVKHDVNGVQGEDHRVPGTDYHGDTVGPLIIPGHQNPSDFAPSKGGQKSATGVSIVYLTIDTLDQTEHFLKKVFHEGLCSKAQYLDGGFDRAYLKFGEMHEDTHRVYVELTTVQDKIKPLIDYINKHPATPYDYPKPDVTVVGVKDGSKAYIEWAQSAVELGKKIKLDEVEDKTNIVD